MSSKPPKPTDKPKRTPRAKPAPSARTRKTTTATKTSKPKTVDAPAKPKRTRSPKAEPPPVLSPQDALNSLITLSEAIEAFDLKKKKAGKALESNQIPARKIGKDWLMRREDAQKLWGDGADSTLSVTKGTEHAVLNEVITSAEAAEELGLKKKAIRKAAKSGAIPARKLKKGWLIRRADVQAIQKPK